jgi:hypothetical protein
VGQQFLQEPRANHLNDRTFARADLLLGLSSGFLGAPRSDLELDGW